MAATTIGSSDPLPDEIKRLVDRGLHLMRWQEGMQLSGVKAGMRRRTQLLLDNKKGRPGTSFQIYRWCRGEDLNLHER